METLDRQLEGRTLSDQEAAEMAMESLRACRDRLSQVADLSAYHSANSAADIHELRQALGYGRINLWGGSYGTRLALEVMRLYPNDLRSVVLDAVYPPDVDLYVDGPGNFKRSLSALFESCASNVICQESFPGLEEVFFATVAHLNEEPVLREITDAYSGQSYDTLITGNTLLALTFQMLYDSKLRYFIPQIIFDVSNGDFNYVEKVYGSLLGTSSIASRGMMLSVQCQEELAFSSQGDFLAELDRHPELAGMYQYAVIGGLAYQACQDWPAGKADPSANQPVSSEVPTLIRTGEYDPITPPVWGLQASESLENAYVFEFPGIGHGASGADDCPRSMMVAFLREPRRAPEANCISAMH